MSVRPCWSSHPQGYRCDLPAGHTGQHRDRLTEPPVTYQWVNPADVTVGPAPYFTTGINPRSHNPEGR